CAGAEIKYVKPDFNAPDLVGVLPANNESTDLTAPKAVEGAVSGALIGMGYFPIVTPVQEAILKGLGLTDGGQMNAFKIGDLEKALGVDGAVTTDIETFSKVNLGVYISPTVAATVSLYGQDGDKLWTAHSKYTTKQFNLSASAIIQNAATSLATDVLSKTLHVQLVPESQMMGGLLVQKAQMNKPSLNYPGPGGLPAAGASASK
ncbi:MAG: DUF799 family lipoprotein, partial [Elusimicrobia bacterium]|nr:DUF799 family lipoprotein [Elusimicrobiota bacterium]